MPDFARHQTPDYVAREFDRSDDTLGTEPRGRVSPEIEGAVRRAYLDANLLHGCGRCLGAFWRQDKRDEHQARCGA